MPNGRFEDRTAIVTGAGRGMGRAVAKILAREGASVVINDIRAGLVDSVVKEIEDAGWSAMRCVADVSVQDKVSAMVSATVDRFGAVDILVNSAGILRRSDGLESISLEEWQAVLDVNLTGVFLCTRAVLPIMKERGGGKIVNVSSSAGRSSSAFGGAHYTASKAGVLGLTRHTAREVAEANINVNAVTPGPTDTDMVRDLIPPEGQEAMCRQIPIGRLGSAEEIAHAIVFLCSEASSYITGATLDVNGGILMM